MELKDKITIAISSIGAAIAIITAIKALIEYRKQGITKRAEIFLQMRSRLREDPSFKNICQLLETDDEELKEVSLIEKDRFIGFFEEFALMKNSGFINNHVSFYMFGYFAVKCLGSQNFWYKLNKTHNLWALFMDFAKQMKEAQQSFEYDRKNFHL